MKISVFGLGYVGCVTAACFAKAGHDIIGVDIAPYKIDAINRGEASVKEKGLDSLVKRVVRAKKLSATADTSLAIEQSDISFVCVGTPPRKDGGINLSYVIHAVKDIGLSLRSKQGHIIVIRSTMIPGSFEKVKSALESSSGKKEGKDFFLAINPEFMREGDALNDFYHPSFVVIGAEKKIGKIIARAYRGVSGKFFYVQPNVAEMIKYANNSFHAMKVTFANEIGTLCKALNVDGKKLMGLFCEDTKLNLSPYYLMPGFAYGGSCLPKELAALSAKARELKIRTPLLDIVRESNYAHITRAIELIRKQKGTTIGVLGIAFKKDTDDIRGNPLLLVLNKLLQKQYHVKIYLTNFEKANLKSIAKSYRETVYDLISRRDLKTSVKSIHSLFSPFEEVIKSDILLFSSRDNSLAAALKKLTPKQTLVDLHGTLSPPETSAKYVSLC